MPTDTLPPVPFHDLAHADLTLEREYEGGRRGNAGDDPLGKLLPVGNMGGFRINGSIAQRSTRLVALYTSGAEIDWPDTIDPETGDFAYYGDNRTPGRALHDTPRMGNALLRDIFAWSRADPEDRLRVPPIFLFEKGARGRNVRFRGLLAPGSPRLTAEEELVAVWRTTRDYRFQNYRAHFTMLTLEDSHIAAEWIDEILAGDPLGEHCPKSWRRWVQGRIFDALEAPRTRVIRTREDQYPTPSDQPLLDAVYAHFQTDPVAFEHFAASAWLHSDPHVESVDVTRPSRDGGRDALGTYRVGPDTDPIRITFALEAKCYRPGSGIGVRMVSRLISRIKHRDFGVFVTTSHIGSQPYAEIRADQHPIVFMTGRDIVAVLKKMGHRTVHDVQGYLANTHPISARHAVDTSAPQAVSVDVTIEAKQPRTTFSHREA